MMTKKRSQYRLIGLALCLVISLAGLASAQSWQENLELTSGDTLNYVARNHSLNRIIVGDPAVVHVDVVDKDEIILIGRQMGQTKILLRDNSKNTTTLSLFVAPDVSLLKKRLYDLFPNQNIKIFPNASGVILSGTVTGAEIIEQVLRVSRQILATPDLPAPKPIKLGEGVKKAANKDELAVVIAQDQTISSDSDQKSSGGSGGAATGRSGPDIINMMTVSGPQQVLLEVKLAEVSRNATRELEAGIGLSKLGRDFSGGFSATGVIGGTLGTVADSSSPIPNLVNASGSLFLNLSDAANVFVNIDNFTTMLRFLEQERLGRILAEPRLVTQNGQEASFLAGGQFPYQQVEDGEVEVKFKDFGVGLKFTPIIGSDGLITLRVSPSVSDITELIETSTGVQPILSTRKLESTVHLRDGQTLALAGLLQDTLTESVQKIPFLGDIPVLGALFRSTNYQQSKTDLLVAVTPHIVQPVSEGQLSFPGEFIKPPNRFEFYLEGRLEGRRNANDRSQLSQHQFSSAVSLDGGGLEGDFGHMDQSN